MYTNNKKIKNKKPAIVDAIKCVFTDSLENWPFFIKNSLP
jgi:hypothetical protein